MISDYTRLIAIGILITAFSGTMVAQATQRIGDFVFVSGLDDFDDTDRSLIGTSGEDGGVLTWRCMSDGLNVVLDVETYYGGDDDDDIQVRYRFDRDEASGYEYWRLFPGQNEVSYQRMNQVPGFTLRAELADSVIVEAVDPLDDESNRFTFGLDGFSEALNLLSCADK
jgi:hypothetical protein